jgi:hypothetical protein
MPRGPNTTVHGRPFDRATILAVWNKLPLQPKFPDGSYKLDPCGTWIQWSAYGDTEAQYGWEVDHIVPVAKGGQDVLSNLQALFWLTNRQKGDSYPWSCAMAGART